MAEQFLHGVEVLEIDAGPRPIQTVRSSVIGIVGTAPNADATVFPLNTPVLIAGSRAMAAKLDLLGTGEGTLPAALDSIFDQSGAVVIVVRVDEGMDAATTLANVLGGVDANTGQYLGLQGFLAAESVLGFAPRILLAPGFTQTRTDNGLLTVTASNAGAGYTPGTYDLDITGGGGTGAQVQAVVGTGGTVTSVKIIKPGSGYTTDPTLTLPAGAGTPTTAATFTVTRGTVGNAVVAELIGVAERLRAVIIADGPNTNDADAIAYAGDFGSKRVYMVDPEVIKVDSSGNNVVQFASPCVAGLIAKVDNELGFWWSPSNQTINGIIGTARSIDFALSDVNSRANLLNEKFVATIIRQNGYRLWGNRTLSSDPKWTFLNVVRTADIINDSILRAHLWAVDRNITKTYIQDVTDSVNAYLRTLTNLGAILGGTCYADPDLNTPDQIAAGKVYFDFEFTPPTPAEHIIFRSKLVDTYFVEVL